MGYLARLPKPGKSTRYIATPLMVTRKVFCFESMFIDTKILVYVF